MIDILWDGVFLVQEPIPVLEQFLELVLEHWSGNEYREEVLQLVSHLSLQPFDSEDIYIYIEREREREREREGERGRERVIERDRGEEKER